MIHFLNSKHKCGSVWRTALHNKPTNAHMKQAARFVAKKVGDRPEYVSELLVLYWNARALRSTSQGFSVALGLSGSERAKALVRFVLLSKRITALLYVLS